MNVIPSSRKGWHILPKTWLFWSGYSVNAWVIITLNKDPITTIRIAKQTQHESFITTYGSNELSVCRLWSTNIPAYVLLAFSFRLCLSGTYAYVTVKCVTLFDSLSFQWLISREGKTCTANLSTMNGFKCSYYCSKNALFMSITQ